jgi:hypothetical protein
MKIAPSDFPAIFPSCRNHKQVLEDGKITAQERESVYKGYQDSSSA